jgi:hypothetical protein
VIRQTVALGIIEEQLTPTARHAPVDTSALTQITEFRLNVPQGNLQMKRSPFARIAQMTTTRSVAKNTAPQSHLGSQALPKVTLLFARTRLTQTGANSPVRHVQMGSFAQEELGMA